MTDENYIFGIEKMLLENHDALKELVGKIDTYINLENILRRIEEKAESGQVFDEAEELLEKIDEAEGQLREVLKKAEGVLKRTENW